MTEEERQAILNKYDIECSDVIPAMANSGYSAPNLILFKTKSGKKYASIVKFNTDSSAVSNIVEIK